VVLVGSDGLSHGTAYIAGTATGPLANFLPGQGAIVAGVPSLWEYQGDGVPALQAPLFLPYGVVVDSGEDIFIADTDNNRIRRIDGKSGLISTIAGNGEFGSTGDGGPAKEAQLAYPTSLLVDGAGNVLFADTLNSSIRRIDAVSGQITTIAGRIGAVGYAGDGTAATSALLNAPNGIALDLNNNLYIADTGNNVIRRVDANTGVISTIAGTGVAGFSGDLGPAVGARLNGPWGVAPSPDETRVYIADTSNNRIRLIDSTGIITTFAGTGAGKFSGDGGPAAQANFYSPSAVTFDVAGNLYIADTGNDRVRRVGASSGTVMTFAGWSSTTFYPTTVFYDNSPANAVGLSGPYSISFDDVGNLFISNVFMNNIREVVANKAVLSYPNMTVNRISGGQEQTIENIGNGSLTFDFIQEQSDAVILASTSSCSTTASLLPLEQCSIDAEFAPTSIGYNMWYFGFVNIVSSATNSPGVLSLTSNVFTSDSTATTLASNSNAATAGESIRFDVTVSSYPATGVDPNLIAPATAPTGTVSLVDGTTLIGSGTLVPPGVVSIYVSDLAVGSHSITAKYGGDSNNDGSISQAVLQVVQQPLVATATSLTTSANPAAAGSLLLLKATIAPASSSGNSTMGGTVTFMDGNILLGKATVQNSIAQLSVSQLSVGQHVLSAIYSGDASYAPSNSAAISQGISSVTNVTIASGANPSLVLDNVTLTVMVANNIPSAPSGKVVLAEGATVVGTQSLSTSGMATFVLTSPTLGTHALVATYSGDNENLPASSPSLNQVVILRPTTNTLTSSATSLTVGQTVTLLAVIQGTGSISPTGIVTFTAGTVVLGTASLGSTGVAQLTLSPAQGTYAITGNYSGDSLYAASTSVAATITVGPTATFNLSPTPASLTVQSGQHQSITVNVAPSSTFSDTLALGCAGLPADATCTFSTDQIAVGGGVTKSFSVVVDTGDPLGSSASLRSSPIQNTYACALSMGSFLSFLLAFNRRRLRRINARLPLFLVILLIGGISSLVSGCASNLNVSHTPAGNYTFQIVATGNKTAVTNSIAVQLTVTQ
jgi:sugar lactone lactonase YvrE